MTERRLTTIAIINRFGHWLSTGLVVPVLAIFQIDRGLSLSQVGINGAVYACVIAVMEIPTGGLADTLGRRNVYALSLLAKLLSVLLLAFAFSPLQLAAGLRSWALPAHCPQAAWMHTSLTRSAIWHVAAVFSGFLHELGHPSRFLSRSADCWEASYQI